MISMSLCWKGDVLASPAMKRSSMSTRGTAVHEVLRRAYAWSVGEVDTWSYPSVSDQIVEISSANSSGVQLGFSW
ncbi:hypothetical protein M2283_009202 [Streptomyces pseudovenezuelae]|uniref:PD-(D/E)XK endonuclease-like domain-containing protein n=1 Tax=Streptomyces pseudovenezuelae TaxID=67350 RepID=A0ABT6LZX2_9ACTN|nr:hypothetical protein [Streptomyces pseudovenezuelae]